MNPTTYISNQTRYERTKDIDIEEIMRGSII